MNDRHDSDERKAFYRRVLGALQAGNVRFLIGGAFAFAQFTGIRRPTKDLDIFICAKDWDRLADIATKAGWRTDLKFPHWLGKVYGDKGFADIIFNSGNGLSPVDDVWFEHSVGAHMLGLDVKLAPIEENLWTKAFIMERERYDGGDVAHLIHACAMSINWERLRDRFGAQWRVLLSHLVLFGFIYPSDRQRVPPWLMDELMDRLRTETHAAAPPMAICAGTLLSREQYLPDVAASAYEDARLVLGSMQAQDVAAWTAAIKMSE